MKMYTCLLLLLLLFGCERQIKIDDHFLLSSFDTGDLSLTFLDDNNYMFSVVESNIIAYLKCNNHIYIVQKPLDSANKSNDHSLQYYIIDVKVDYSDERNKVYSISQSRFEEMLGSECGDKSLNKL